MQTPIALALLVALARGAPKTGAPVPLDIDDGLDLPEEDEATHDLAVVPMEAEIGMGPHGGLHHIKVSGGTFTIDNVGPSGGASSSSGSGSASSSGSVHRSLWTRLAGIYDHDDDTQFCIAVHDMTIAERDAIHMLTYKDDSVEADKFRHLYKECLIDDEYGAACVHTARVAEDGSEEVDVVHTHGESVAGGRGVSLKIDPNDCPDEELRARYHTHQKDKKALDSRRKTMPASVYKTECEKLTTEWAELAPAMEKAYLAAQGGSSWRTLKRGQAENVRLANKAKDVVTDLAKSVEKQSGIVDKAARQGQSLTKFAMSVGREMGVKPEKPEKVEKVEKDKDTVVAEAAGKAKDKAEEKAEAAMSAASDAQQQVDAATGKEAKKLSAVAKALAGKAVKAQEAVPKAQAMAAKAAEKKYTEAEKTKAKAAAKAEAKKRELAQKRSSDLKAQAAELLKKAAEAVGEEAAEEAVVAKKAAEAAEAAEAATAATEAEPEEEKEAAAAEPPAKKQKKEKKEKKEGTGTEKTDKIQKGDHLITSKGEKIVVRNINGDYITYYVEGDNAVRSVRASECRKE